MPEELKTGIREEIKKVSSKTDLVAGVPKVGSEKTNPEIVSLGIGSLSIELIPKNELTSFKSKLVNLENDVRVFGSKNVSDVVKEEKIDNLFSIIDEFHNSFENKIDVLDQIEIKTQLRSIAKRIMGGVKKNLSELEVQTNNLFTRAKEINNPQILAKELEDTSTPIGGEFLDISMNLFKLISFKERIKDNPYFLDIAVIERIDNLSKLQDEIDSLSTHARQTESDEEHNITIADLEPINKDVAKKQLPPSPTHRVHEDVEKDKLNTIISAYRDGKGSFHFVAKPKQQPKNKKEVEEISIDGFFGKSKNTEEVITPTTKQNSDTNTEIPQFATETVGSASKVNVVEEVIPENISQKNESAENVEVEQKVENKNLAKMIGLTAYKTIASVAGLKFVGDIIFKKNTEISDLGKYLSEKSTAKTERVLIEQSLENLITIARARRTELTDTSVPGLKEKEPTARKIELKAAIADFKKSINESVQITPVEKSDLLRRLAFIVADHTNSQERLDIARDHRIKEATVEYVQAKTSAVNIAKQAINTSIMGTALINPAIAAGLRMGRGVLYAGLSFAERVGQEKTSINKETSLRAQEHERTMRKAEVLAERAQQDKFLFRRTELMAKYQVMSEKEKYGLTKEDMSPDGTPLTTKAHEVLEAKINSMLATQDAKKELGVRKIEIDEKVDSFETNETKGFISKTAEATKNAFVNSFVETISALRGKGTTPESEHKIMDRISALGKIATAFGIAGSMTNLSEIFGKTENISFEPIQPIDHKTVTDSVQHTETPLSHVSSTVDSTDTHKLTTDDRVDSVYTMEKTNLSATPDSITQTLSKHVASSDQSEKAQDIVANTKELVRATVHEGDSVWKLAHAYAEKQGIENPDTYVANLLKANDIGDFVNIKPGDTFSIGQDHTIFINDHPITQEMMNHDILIDHTDAVQDSHISTDAGVTNGNIHNTTDTSVGSTSTGTTNVPKNIETLVDNSNTKESLTSTTAVQDSHISTDAGVTNGNIHNTIDTSVGSTSTGTTNVPKNIETLVDNSNTKESLTSTTNATSVIDQTPRQIEKTDITSTQFKVDSHISSYNETTHEIIVGDKKIDLDTFVTSTKDMVKVVPSGSDVSISIVHDNGTRDCILLDNHAAEKLHMVFDKNGIHKGDEILVGGQKLKMIGDTTLMPSDKGFPSVKVLQGTAYREAKVLIEEEGVFLKLGLSSERLLIAEFPE